MDRSPLYKTFATRYFEAPKKRKRLPFVIIGVIVLALIAIVLGRGLPVSTLQALEASTQASRPGVDRPEVVNQQLIAAPAATTVAKGSPVAASGGRFQVVNTNGIGLHLRPQPNLDNQPIKRLPDGTVVTVVGKDVVDSNHVWKRVRDSAGIEGWCAAEYLQPAP